jgi:hypothetical protein
VGPRAVLDALAKRIIPSPRRESNLDGPAPNLVTILTELSRLVVVVVVVVVVVMMINNNNNNNNNNNKLWKYFCTE